MEKSKIGSTRSQAFPLVIYEVFRVIDGIPVFLDDHLTRLYHSARLTGLESLPGPVALHREIMQFIADQKNNEGNIKLSFTYRDAESAPESKVQYISHAYPSSQDYRDGVRVEVMEAVRPVPNAKVQYNDIRNRANQMIADLQLYEVLLVDGNNKITEGSRSNVFFIRDNMVFTSPAAKVLEGITRNKVIDLCRNAGIPVVESEIPADRLDGYVAAFITGTSPKVLPIASVGEVWYRTDLPLLQTIMQLYNRAIADYIGSHHE